MNQRYFSDKEKGPKSREGTNISHEVWGGIVALIDSLITKGAFGLNFPVICDDGAGIIGTHAGNMELAIKAEIPDIKKISTKIKNNDAFVRFQGYTPPTLAILDLIEFCFDNIAKPSSEYYHSYYKHNHLAFDQELGRVEFRDKINLIFARNGLAYELEKEGTIKRLVSTELQELLDSSNFKTGDETLDTMLKDARKKFLNPDPKTRKESLERLWDAWERIKTLKDTDKKKSIEKILDDASAEKTFREELEKEARTLTDIGNTFHIRHSETTQVHLKSDSHVDYLFHRLYALIHLILNSIIKNDDETHITTEWT
jgi:hypothetical protein